MFSAEVSRAPQPTVLSWALPGAAALAGSLVVYGVAGRVAGPLLVAGPAGVVAVPIGAVVLGTVVGTVAAAALVGLARRARRPRGLYLLLVSVGLLLSAVPSLQAAIQVDTAVWLLVLHGVVAAALVPVGCRRLAAQRS